MRTGAMLVGRGVDFESLDTREVSRAIVWAVRDDELQIPGAAFLRRSYALDDPGERAAVFVLVEGGAVFRAEVGYEGHGEWNALKGYGIWAAASRHGFPMPGVSHGYPDSMPRVWPV